MDPGRRLADGAIWRAYNSPTGPVTLRVERTQSGVRGTAWGKGSEHALEILPDLVGADDDPRAFQPDHPLLTELIRRKPGIRFGKTHDPVGQLIVTIPGQRVTSKNARQTRRELAYRFGEMAPGPAGLRLPPDPEKIATLSYANLHNAGLERSRATTLLEVCRRANRIRQLGERPHEDAARALQSIRGIGPWTANHVVQIAWGWTDAIQLGDYWLPSIVVHALTGKARAEDDEMLELLEPFRPHRARVIKLIAASGIKPPRFGPKLPVRDIRSH